MHSLRNKTSFRLAIAAVVACAAAGVAWRSHGTAPPVRAKKPPLVGVTQARTADIPLDLSTQGHVVALNFVDVRPQLTGTIASVHFHEGDDVRPGQLLFTLDDSDARAQLAKAEAQAAMIAVQLADARREYQRAQSLAASRFIAVSAVDTAAGKVDALVAQVRAAQAEVSGARTSLSRTRIVSPIAGRAGAVNVHQGSLAQAGGTPPLVTIAQFSPIGVEFNLPERDLPALLAARKAGAVRVSLDGQAGAAQAGELSFVNNTINQDSGSIDLKASFPNPDKTLWPGAFVRVVVHAGLTHAAVVLAPQAVQEGPAGRFVFLVGADRKVVARPVDLLRLQDGMAVVGGLEAGARVVLEGGHDLRDGMAVRVDGGAGQARSTAMVTP